MTGVELLISVKKQFQVIYLADTLLDALLEQALRTYQNKAGPFADVTFPADAGEITTPADFSSVAVAMDASGRWQEVTRVKTPAAGEEPATDKLVIASYTASAVQSFPVGYYGAGRVAVASTVKPYRVYYFQKLTAEGELPEDSISILFNYLSALIEIPNNKRAREVANATGMSLEFPSDDELKQRKDLLEVDMEDSRSMIPPAAVF